MSIVRTIRRAILVGFVGATLWAVVFSRFIFAEIENLCTAGDPCWRDPFFGDWALFSPFWCIEVAIVAMAAVAWVLAGMVKSKVT